MQSKMELDNLHDLGKSLTVIFVFATAIQFSHINHKSLFQHQLTLDLTGVDQNSFSHFSNETTEDSCFANCLQNNWMSMCRPIWLKKKYVAFLKGDMIAAAKMYDQEQEYPRGSIGKTE